uniref:Retrovirus-related Pol polyprotein from transposon TNT 1-94 n=1 Tax=Tanacetum cinerariifolium TaxID=118510 RepID=A0A6L2M270_TANCI|nr:hypothetical protein [Tanacetum cinerariifolium]
MSGTVPPIPPPLGTNTDNPTIPNRTDPIPVDITNNTATTNDSDLDVKEDTRSSSKFLADLNVEFRHKALLSNQKRYYKSFRRVGSAKKPIEKTKETCFACGKLVPSKDEGVTKVKAFIAITEEEPSVGKNDAKSGQWVIITMKKVQRIFFMIDGDERGHVLDYSHVDLHYVKDQSKNLLSMFNSLNQELSSSNVLTLANVSLTLTVSEEIRKVPEKRSAVKAPKEKAQTMSPSASDPIHVKKANSSTKKLLLNLMEELVEDLRIADDQVSSIIEPISNVEPSPTIISPSAKVFINPHGLQDRWSTKKHIELVNILGELQDEVTTRSKIRDSKATSVHECLYVNFLSEIKPKKLIEALKEEGWMIAMQEELNQFERNKV